MIRASFFLHGSLQRRLSSSRSSKRTKKNSLLKVAKDLKTQLIKANLRVNLDERDGFSPGYKFNDWEMRGVPVRVELGPKDVAKQAAMLARRDKPGKEGKVSVPLADIAGTIEKLLIDIHQSMFDKALAFRRANTHEIKDYAEFKKAVRLDLPLLTGAAMVNAKKRSRKKLAPPCVVFHWIRNPSWATLSLAALEIVSIAANQPKTGLFSAAPTDFPLTQAFGQLPTKNTLTPMLDRVSAGC